MSLPVINPLAYGWFTPRTPIDHLETTTLSCPVCRRTTYAERYRVILGVYVGVGAP